MAANGMGTGRDSVRSRGLTNPGDHISGHRGTGGAAAQAADRNHDVPHDVGRAPAVFRRVNPAMVALWRLGLGRLINMWPSGSGRILVVGHTGRRTGLRRWTPLNYTESDGSIYCVAAYGKGSDWYRNITADPRVEVWPPGQRWLGLVEDVSDVPERVRLIRKVLRASGFAARAAGLDPKHMDDETFAAATSSYRLLQIRPATGGRPLPEHPRPGDLAFWWAAPVAAAALWAAGRRTRGRSGTG